MKKFIIKTLLAGLGLFERLLVSKFPSEWVKKISELAIARFRLFGEALIDANPDDKAQLEQIARETLVSQEFTLLESFVTAELAAKIENEKLAQVVLSTDKLRLDFLALLVDGNKDNSKQIKELFESFIRTEDFDTIAISLAELLAEKYAKNPEVRDFLVSLVRSLVDSDDNKG